MTTSNGTAATQSVHQLTSILKSVSIDAHKAQSEQLDSAANPNISPLQRERLAYEPIYNPILSDPSSLSVVLGDPTSAAYDVDAVSKLFPNLFGQPIVQFSNAKPTLPPSPKTVAVVLSGGPAPGGHNVICGLHDYLRDYHPQSRLLGFLSGPDGILKKKYVELNQQAVDKYRNQGGFHMIGSGRTKIETPEQFESARQTATELDLDALVVIGGDDSNSNAMKLAEDFKAHGIRCAVNGVPKTIDNDLRNAQIEVSFGFDTAVKSYCQSVASLAFDAVSARKAWHFIRVMGRSASHIALECALQTHPNLCFIGEEVKERGMTLSQIVSQIVDVVCECAEQGKNYGVVVLPEGLVEFMPDVEALIGELNEVLASNSDVEMSKEDVMQKLSQENSEVLGILPDAFADQLMLERDPHGNVQVAKIEAERLLIGMVSAALSAKKKDGSFKGKFSGVPHYLGYEARCAMPSNFDANYTYGLGRVAGALCCDQKTGYIATLSGLTNKADEWIPAGYPLTMMMNMERRHGTDVAVIKKKLVELDGLPFKTFEATRDGWRLGEQYRSPGCIQFWGPVANSVTLSLLLDSQSQ